MNKPSPTSRRTLSRAISRMADAPVAEVLALAEGGNAAAQRIGITGPPGAGKSTLIAQLVRERLRREGNIAVVAIDPTSPVSGGAILGDRIRMAELATDPRVYIRSLASRGSLDGLADNLPSILDYLGVEGFAEVIVETVGVGQVEYEVRHLVDTLVLTLIPGAGDQIQAMKGGILETADIIAINKADLPGAKQLMSELRAVLELKRVASGGWVPPLVPTSAGDPMSVAALSEAIDQHQAWSLQSGSLAAARGERRRHHAGSLVTRRLHEVLRALPHELLDEPLSGIYAEVLRRLGE